ncbi:unnamed protein product, partial [Mesorhabditis belari]|uniref:C2H2-type domain-containing protein n=1 Tax=Mesorhabditis belari TaxID=2138241 RepID=A0AAF3J3B9_9BILA
MWAMAKNVADSNNAMENVHHSLLNEGAPSLVNREILQHVCSSLDKQEDATGAMNETLLDESFVNSTHKIVKEERCDGSSLHEDEGFLEEEEIEVEFQSSQQTDQHQDLISTRPSDSGMFELENEAEKENFNTENEPKELPKVNFIEPIESRHTYAYEFGNMKRKGFEEKIEELENEVEEIRERKIIRKINEQTAQFGVGGLLSALRSEDSLDTKDIMDTMEIETVYPEIMAPQWAAPLESLVKREMYERQILEKTWLHDQLLDIPAPPPHPTTVKDVQRLVRSKMPRCKFCKTRFCENILVDFHIKEQHPDEYPLIELEQEQEAHEMRSNEREQNRIEELVYGGFIPPEEDYLAENAEYDVEEIPLPGEETLTGKAPRFVDRWGTMLPKVRKYWKKVSPQCPFCDKRFRNELSLKKHFRKAHSLATKPVQCLRCFKILESKENLGDHVCDLTFLCFECTPIRNLCSAIRLASHRAKFHRGANSGFKCFECQMKFLTPRKLRKHRKMTHVFTKVFQCHFCDEHFISETAVTTHERIHTGIIKFECTICDFRCNRYLEMENHKRDEHGYLCSICQLCFGDWSEMKAHTLHDHEGYLTSDADATYIESPRVWVMFKGE